MSSVRMCDRCGRIFSENEEGWSTFTGAVKRRDKASGRAYTESAEQDACPEHSPGGLTQPTLRPQIGAAPEPGPVPGRYDERIASLEREEILDRTAALERELADLREQRTKNMAGFKPGAETSGWTELGATERDDH